MRTLRCGLIGFGFIGPHHLDAIRRLGFVEISAICTTHPEEAREKARQHQVPRGYGDYRELLADPAIDVVDINTPPDSHRELALAALAAGKHVIVDKPMAITAAEAREMLIAARAAARVHAITFNIRYNPVLQHARAMVAKGQLGRIQLFQGHYLQEWLLYDTDYSWRLDPARNGPIAMVSEAGVHWYDLCQHLTGHRIVSVLADLSTTVKTRRRPRTGTAKPFQADPGGFTDPVSVEVPDFGAVLLQFDNGARGVFTNSAMCAGRKNDLRLEISGTEASLEWRQERPNELWIGRRGAPNETILKDPGVLDSSVRHYASLPGGHNEGWPDAFRNLMRNIFTFIAEDRDPATADGVDFPTFETGLRITCITDAIHQSHLAGGRWTPVNVPADDFRSGTST